MTGTIVELDKLTEEWLRYETVPEVDWSRIRTLEFQDTLQSRDTRAEDLKDRACLSCPDFAEHVSCYTLFVNSQPKGSSS